MNDPLEFQIGSAQLTDIVHVCDLHENGIKTGFLTSLGKGFLTRFYHSMIHLDSAVLLVARNPEGKIYGFVSGTEDVTRLYRDFLRSPYVLHAIVELVKNFLFASNKSDCPKETTIRNKIYICWKWIFRIWETLTYTTKDEIQSLPKSELLSIVVNSGIRGSDVATQLMGALKSAFFARNVLTFKIVVSAENMRARRYYEKMGGVPVAEIQVHQGEVSYVYIINSF